MTDQIKAYLDDLAVSRTLRNRVAELTSYYGRLVPEAVDEIFITDYVNSDGVRQFENLWLFTATTIGEAKAFLEKENLDSVLRSRSARHWRIESEHFNFEGASDASRMNAKVTLEEGALMSFQASGGNCDHLLRIFKEHVIPLMR